MSKLHFALNISREKKKIALGTKNKRERRLNEKKSLQKGKQLVNIFSFMYKRTCGVSASPFVALMGHRRIDKGMQIEMLQ
jgi:hypothetical protein